MVYSFVSDHHELSKSLFNVRHREPGTVQYNTKYNTKYKKVKYKVQ